VTYADFCATSEHRAATSSQAAWIKGKISSKIGEGSVSVLGYTVSVSGLSVSLSCNQIADSGTENCEELAHDDYVRCINNGHSKPGSWTDWSACLSSYNAEMADCEDNASYTWQSDVGISATVEAGNNEGSIILDSEFVIGSDGSKCLDNVYYQIYDLPGWLTNYISNKIDDEFPSGGRVCL
jgi:hypothetical protein